MNISTSFCAGLFLKSHIKTNRFATQLDDAENRA